MTLAELYLEAARVAKMIEGTDLLVDQMVKFRGRAISKFNPADNSLASDYEFALAIVEGKPVFEGDELYDHNPTWANYPKLKVDHSCIPLAKTVSWNPPKPKTVMVELLVEDAKRLAGGSGSGGVYYNGVPLVVVCNACAKALEELKS